MDSRFRNDYRHLGIPSLTEVTESCESRYSLPYPISDLTNEIHPIFSPLNFPGADYEILKPALRLASLLIDIDCLLDFWHAVFFGDNREVFEDFHGEQSHWAYFRPRSELSALDRAKTRLRLKTLSTMFKFYRDKAMHPSFLGTCMYTNRVSQCHPYETGDVRGVVDEIWYSESIYRRFLDSCKWGEENGISDELISRMREDSFELAVLLVHELAHAAVATTVGIENQAVFENNTMAEDGMDWEAFTLGGPLSRRTQEGLAIGQWPSPSLARHYAKNDSPLWMVASECDDVDLHWNIAESFIEDVFSQAFWDDTVAKVGADALKVDKRVGHRCKLRHDCWRPFYPRDEDADRFDGVPEGYWANGETLYRVDGAQDAGFDGFSRLMRINIEGLWGEELALQRQKHPPPPETHDPHAAAEEVGWEESGTSDW